MLQTNLPNSKGFTLLEMTIALGIFVILFTLTLGVYSYALKAEQRTIQISKLQREAQFIMEIIAKKIRSGKIDYTYYDNDIESAGESDLALLDSSGNQTVFRFSEQNISVCIVNCSFPENFYVIPPTDVFIGSLQFFIDPLTNPFTTLNTPPDKFPKVTIILDLVNTRAGSTRHLEVQQTVPQRLAGF
ncbi:prepilin-type N-terminal cleavage/methylation domain-containing protein [Candidatus Kuenenbacteria bacterium]|nr:prepilin-type N-terminal cleavage/methylation domain-containing protein [Candidatus Kuenenbacteria bacterium]